jgi:hypothetical protein
MYGLMKKNQIIKSEIAAFLIFGLAYLTVSFLPEDEISTKIKMGIVFL